MSGGIRRAVEKWLREFLGKLRFDKRISLVHPLDYLREHEVRGLIYLDTGSYDKMLEWSNGFFRNFLYPESNNMHKKALWILRKLEKANLVDKAPLDYLMAYCNDAYWHGLFGGVYLAHLRQAIYESLIRTERDVEEKTGYYSSNIVKRILVDFDHDGTDELLIETPMLNLYIKPSDGGTLFEFDFKEKNFEHNIQDTMSRYREPYLEGSGFNPDWYRRVSLRLHVWSPDTSAWD
ncbi:MAG: alpha-amylase/4-alpha-glucanotransferase domain-containing protein [Ignisphaera sp.]